MVQTVLRFENQEEAPALCRTARFVSSALAESCASVPCWAAIVLLVLSVAVARGDRQASVALSRFDGVALFFSFRAAVLVLVIFGFFSNRERCGIRYIIYEAVYV